MQRVAIARALVNDPDADPCRRAHRQPRHQDRRGHPGQTFQRLNDEGRTIVLITHEPRHRRARQAHRARPGRQDPLRRAASAASGGPEVVGDAVGRRHRRDRASRSSSNKVRSALTILGIVVGIASVIVMVAIGQGAQASITSSHPVGGIQPHQVMPGFGGGGGGGARGARGAALSLTTGGRRGDRSSEVQGVAAVVAGAVFSAAGGRRRQQHQHADPGRDAGLRDGHSTDGRRGRRSSRPEDVASVARVAVLGPTTRDDLFGVGRQRRRAAMPHQRHPVQGRRRDRLEGRQRLRQPGRRRSSSR